MSNEIIEQAPMGATITGSTCSIIEAVRDDPTLREKIERLQASLSNPEEMAAMGMIPADIPVEHFHAHRLYARMGVVKKGYVVVGHIKKFSHFNVFNGDISICTEEGPKRVTGFCMMEGAPGTKRVVYAHEDTTWVTIHGTDETEEDKIRGEVLAASYTDYLEFCNEQQRIEGGPSCGQQ